MLTSTHLEQRVLALMQKGAKLWFEFSYHPDFGTFLCKVTLDHRGEMVVLSHFEKIPGVRWDSEGPFYALVNPLGDNFVERPDVKQGYCYNSDCDSRYRKVYEHANTLVPWWVTQQVGWDDNGQLE